MVCTPTDISIKTHFTPAMAKQIEGFLQTSKTYFVAVGAGHLIGEQGILSQLRQKHFQVDQL